MLETELQSEADLVGFGGCFAGLVGEHALVSLSGDLGAGKTTFVRGLLQAAGHTSAVKSPTFSLVEPYELASGTVFHFDFYRLQDPEELEYIGLRDYLHQSSLCLVEWPEKAGDFLPPTDLAFIIEKVEQGRRVRLELNTDRGRALFEQLDLASCFGQASSAIGE